MEQRRDQQQGRQQQQGQGEMRQPQQDMGASSQGSMGGSRGPGQEFPQDDVRGSQQGGASSARQQQQFDTQGSGQQGGGMPGDNRFAEHIREHMEVVDDSGRHCGTVDHIEGDRIKLSRKDSSDGQHHYVQLSQVAGIEGDKVRLRVRGDNDFGMESRS
jgi:hypothetical protein